jgi:hypothetical protein
LRGAGDGRISKSINTRLQPVPNFCSSAHRHHESDLDRDVGVDHRRRELGSYNSSSSMYSSSCYYSASKAWLSDKNSKKIVCVLHLGTKTPPHTHLSSPPAATKGGIFLCFSLRPPMAAPRSGVDRGLLPSSMARAY